MMVSYLFPGATHESYCVTPCLKVERTIKRDIGKRINQNGCGNPCDRILNKAIAGSLAATENTADRHSGIWHYAKKRDNVDPFFAQYASIAIEDLFLQEEKREKKKKKGQFSS